MTVRALGPVSSTTGAAIALDLSTISIGFSNMVSIARIGLIADAGSSTGRGLSFRVSVMSASGVEGSTLGSGDCDGAGVGRGGAKSGAVDFRGLRTRAGALLIFLGDFFVGESGSRIVLCSTGSSISDGSTLSLGTRLLLVVVLVVVATEFVVFLRPAGAFRGLFFGAGVKSSSSSISILVLWSSSSSSESTTTFLRLAPRRDGLTGDSDMVCLLYWWLRRCCRVDRVASRGVVELLCSRFTGSKYTYRRLCR